MKYIGIIPARYASTRFEGKPLADLGGRPVIEHVYRRVEEALGQAAVATDDERILKAVEAFGGVAVMTSDKHRSGTDRCLEAYENLGSQADVVINVQGDEPFVDPDQIRLIASSFEDPATEIATLALPFPSDGKYADLENPNRPKVVFDANGFAMFFSRSVIPYARGVERENWPSVTQYYTHVGMYAFRIATLRRVVALPQSSLELTESLEQLRWLQNGFRIKVKITDKATIGIDTPADLEAARALLRSKN
ncbi:MAG: 3-deoxy-manno-octulosonate cytidylyltransferase [Muribaculaceae bacterium]|nr:3-deoxy-manno-octulosonate cytidylyltransferase [Bacteroidales bacterium]MDY4810576.1 3-deoxy-manno-octulosonate cytidylyltransferase [Muribaculaceae bacterium]